MEAIHLWLIGYLRNSFARGRASLRLQPAVRIALDAGEAVVVGMVDEAFARLSKLLNPAAVAAFVTETVNSVVACVNKEIEMANTPNQPAQTQPQGQQGGQQPGQRSTVGTPGNLFTHLSQLATQLRAKDFAGALGTFIDILNHLSSDWGAVQAVPHQNFAAGGPGVAAGDADGCATAVEQFVQQHQQRMQGAAAGAFPWDQLMPLLIQALMAILNRR